MRSHVRPLLDVVIPRTQGPGQIAGSSQGLQRERSRAVGENIRDDRVGKGVLMGLQETIRDLRARRHTSLLVMVVAMLAVRPFLGDTAVAATVFSLALLL